MTAFRQARWFTATNGRQIDLLVIHSMEIDEKPDTAEGCARHFATSNVKASAHSCVDVDSRVDCVRDKDVAYAAPGANHNGLHLELAGRARQSRAEWLDDYSRPMLEGPAAQWVTEKAKAHNIPLVYLTAAQVKAGQRGVTTHNEIRLAFGKTSHTDPGKGFPMDVLLAAAKEDEVTDADVERVAQRVAQLVCGPDFFGKRVDLHGLAVWTAHLAEQSKTNAPEAG